MCRLQTNPGWIPPAIAHKGAMHKLSQYIQEQQEEGIDCYV